MKKALLLRKQKLLNDLEYYDKRIKYVLANNNNNFDDDGNDSSDSDTGLPNFGGSATNFKAQSSELKVCLKATQELTGLEILQFEVNIMVGDPALDGEPPVGEPGIWREVTAEGRIDHLPFSIMFYEHKPDRLFGPRSYRGVRVSAVKAAHEAELRDSVLTTVGIPADALEVLRSYAIAYRSRRTTLANVAEKYGRILSMEPNTEGGIVLNCANLLKVLWRLKNSRSALAPFYHSMKIDVDFMDECYVKIISDTFNELSNPKLDTDERTFLLSKIIATCAEVQGPTQENESIESITDSVQRVEKSTVEKDTESQEEKKKREANIMAPPKYLPKKGKPKGKENTVENSRKGVKRPNSNDESGNKRAKISEVGHVKQGDVRDENTKQTASNESENESNQASGNKISITELVNRNDKVDDKTKKVASKNNLVKTIKVMEKNAEENTDKTKKAVKPTSNDPTTAKSKVTKDINKDPKSDNLNIAKKSVSANQNAKTKETVNTNEKTNNVNVAGTTKRQKSQENLKGNIVTKKSTTDKNSLNQNQNSGPSNVESTSNLVRNSKKNNEIPKNTNLDARNDNAKTNLAKKQKENNNKPENQDIEPNKIAVSTKITKKSKEDKHPENNNPTKEKGKNELAKKSKTNPNKLEAVTKSNETQKNTEITKDKELNNAKINEKKSVASAKDNTNLNVASSKNKESNTVKKVTENNVATNKNKDKIVDVATGSVASLNRQGSKENLNIKKTVQNKQISAYNNKPPLKILNKHNMPKKVARPGNTGTFLKHSNTEKKVGGIISSKIPQKGMKTVSESATKKNPLRISPRKMAPMFKSSSQSNLIQKMQPTTNIPRLLKTSGPKTKS